VHVPAGTSTLPRRTDISPYEYGPREDGDSPTTALRERLRVVEEELGQLRGTAAHLRRRVGERWDDPTDSAGRADMITSEAEQEAVIEVLENRREDLRSDSRRDRPVHTTGVARTGRGPTNGSNSPPSPPRWSLPEGHDRDV
jgi:hypothetical protein